MLFDQAVCTLQARCVLLGRRVHTVFPVPLANTASAVLRTPVPLAPTIPTLVRAVLLMGVYHAPLARSACLWERTLRFSAKRVFRLPPPTLGPHSASLACTVSRILVIVLLVYAVVVVS